MIAVTMRHCRHISVIHAAGFTLLRVSDQKKSLRCSNVSLETKSPPTKGMSSLCTGQRAKPPWGIRSHHGTISLAPLDRAQVQEMVAELSARHALPKDVVEGLTERTGGVPLFVEEVTRLLLERGGRGGTRAIPPTLQQSLTARLDRLGPAREVARIGAVVGRDFHYGLRLRWTGLRRPTSCWCKVCRRTLSAASTPSSRTLPTKICSRAPKLALNRPHTTSAVRSLLEAKRTVTHTGSLSLTNDCYHVAKR